MVSSSRRGRRRVPGTMCATCDQRRPVSRPVPIISGKAPKNAGKAGPGPVVDVTGDGDKSSATKPNVQGKSPGGSASSTPKATPHSESTSNAQRLL